MAKFDHTIHWHGPFKLDNATDICRKRGWQKGVYVAIGHHRPIPVRLSEPKIQYIGKSTELHNRVSPLHHQQLCRLSRPTSKVWIGQIEKNEDLEEAEKGLIFFLRGRMNIDYRKKLPTGDVNIKNKFYNGRTGRRHWFSPHRDWPRSIRYDSSRKKAVLWHGLHRLKFSEETLSSFKLSKSTKLGKYIGLPSLEKKIIGKYFGPEMSYQDFLGKRQDITTSI